TAWLMPDFLGRHFNPAAAFGVGERSGLPSWASWAIVNGFWFAPGAIVGGLVGELIIRPVNFVLGKFFRGFNRVFNWITSAYGWGVGQTLRITVVVLLVYGGLLGATCFEFQSTPTGFIPQQDKGYLLLNVQLPDSASVERTERMMARIEKLARETPGV